MLRLWSGTVRDGKHTQPFAKSEPEIKIDYFSRRLPQRFILDCSSSLLFNIFSLHPKDDEQTSRLHPAASVDLPIVRLGSDK